MEQSIDQILFYKCFTRQKIHCTVHSLICTASSLNKDTHPQKFYNKVAGFDSVVWCKILTEILLSHMHIC